MTGRRRMLVATLVGGLTLHPGAVHAAPDGGGSDLVQVAYQAHQQGKHADAARMIVLGYDSIQSTADKVRGVHLAAKAFEAAFEEAGQVEHLNQAIELVQRLESDLPTLYGTDQMALDMEAERLDALRQHLKEKAWAAHEAKEPTPDPVPAASGTQTQPGEDPGSTPSTPAPEAPPKAPSEPLPDDFDIDYNAGPPPDPDAKAKDRPAGDGKGLRIAGAVILGVGVPTGLGLTLAGLLIGDGANDDLEALDSGDLMGRKDVIEKGERANALLISGLVITPVVVAAGVVLAVVGKNRSQRFALSPQGMEVRF